MWHRARIGAVKLRTWVLRSMVPPLAWATRLYRWSNISVGLSDSALTVPPLKFITGRRFRLLVKGFASAVRKIVAWFIAKTPPFRFQVYRPIFVLLLLMQTQPPVPPGFNEPSTNWIVPPFWLTVAGPLKNRPIASWLRIDMVPPFTFRTANSYGRVRGGAPAVCPGLELIWMDANAPLTLPPPAAMKVPLLSVIVDPPALLLI